MLGCAGSTFEQWPGEEVLRAVCVNGPSNMWEPLIIRNDTNLSSWLIFSVSGSSWEEDGLGLFGCQSDPSERVTVVGEKL